MENSAFLKSVMAYSSSGAQPSVTEAMDVAQNALFEQFENQVAIIEKEAAELLELTDTEPATVFYQIESTSHDLQVLPGLLGKPAYLCTLHGAASYYGRLEDQPLITPEQIENA